MMDFPSDHTIGQLSYIFDNKIEKEKDIKATILNLVAKKCIKIEKTLDGFEIVDLNYNLDKLKKDEKYIYEWITTDQKHKYSYDGWWTLVKKEMERDFEFTRFKFDSRKIIFVVIPSLLLLLMILTLTKVTSLMPNINKTVLIIMGVSVVFSFMFDLFFELIPEKKKRIYTKEGARIIKKWKRFQIYLKNYSSLKTAKIESIVIWEKYLPYAMALGINLDYKKLNLEEIPSLKFLKDETTQKSFKEFLKK